MPHAVGPLHGYTVLDVSQMIAGPVGATLLADMGADVIKVEPIDGESTRHLLPLVPKESPAFVLLNRGKRSLPLNLETEGGRDVLGRLIERADVAIVGYRPDVCARLHLTYDDFRARNPRIIYLQNTAFGPRGPMAQQGGYDIIVQGLAGLVALNGAVDATGQPRQIVPAIADYMTGGIIAWAVTAGLLHREKTGEGQEIETSLLSSALIAQLARVRRFDVLDAERQAQVLEDIRDLRRRNRPWTEQLEVNAAARVITGNVYYRGYATADSYILVACLNNPTRLAFLRVTGLTDPRMAGGALEIPDAPSEAEQRAVDDLVQAAVDVMRTRTTDEWTQLFVEAHVPAGPLRFPEEVFEDPQIDANDYLAPLDHYVLGPYRTAAPPVRMSATPLPPLRTAPLFGEHTRELLQDLGYDAAAIDTLARQGAVHDRLRDTVGGTAGDGADPHPGGPAPRVDDRDGAAG